MRAARGLCRATCATATILVLLGSACSPSTCQKLHQNTSKFDFRIQQQAQQAPQARAAQTDEQQQQQQAQLNATSPAAGVAPTSHQLASFSDLMLRTYVRVNYMRVYHMDLHSYRPGAKFAGDPSFVNSQSLEHRKLCERHLLKYHNLLRSFSELDNPMQASVAYEAMKLADVFGRPESGVLHGNQFWLGAYDDCLDFKLPDGGSAAADGASDKSSSAADRSAADGAAAAAATISSQYCMGVAGFPNWNPQHTKTALKVGLCLPETCTNAMLNDERHLFELVEQMMQYQFGAQQPFKRVQLRQIYCLPHETSEARQYSLSAKLLIGCLACAVFACLVATVFDYIDAKMPENLKANEQSKRSVLVKAFSLTRNLDKLLASSRQSTASAQPAINQATQADSADQPDTFDRQTFYSVISGLKCIGLMWICCAHTFLVSPITDQNMISFDKFTKTYMANVLLTAHLMVDTFFALSGLLASYLLFRDGLHKYKTKHWIIMTVHRYWRLTPIYLLCYWFTKSLGKSLGQGPFWDYGTSAVSPRLNCENESWLVALLHQSDYKSPKEHCIPFAWFIANGIKFWMVTPVFLLAINKSIRRGYALILATILANILLVGKLSFSSSVDMKSVIEFKPESADNMLNNMGEVYTRPYSRVGTYLIGLLAGHLIYLTETRQIRVNLSKNVNILIWAWFSLTTILLTFVIKIAGGVELDEWAIPWVFSVSSALLRPLWALCTCWLVFALSNGQASWAAKFLSSGVWQVLVKLSFCAYLAQGEVIAQLFLAQTTSSSFRYIDMFSRPIVTICLTFVVSALMVLFIEYPLIGIEQLIFPSKRPTESAKSNTIDQETSANEKKTDNISELARTNGLMKQKSIADSDNSQKIISNGEAKLKRL